MIVSSIKNLGKSNMISKIGYNIKKFLIKTLLEMIDLTSPRFLTLESIISKSFSVRNFFVIDRFM